MIWFKYVDQNLSARSSVFSSLGATTLVRLEVIRMDLKAWLPGLMVALFTLRSEINGFEPFPWHQMLVATTSHSANRRSQIEIIGNLLCVVLSQNVRSQLVDQNQQLEPEFQKSKEPVK